MNQVKKTYKNYKSQSERMNLAKKNKNDEFYTQLQDIEQEMKYYWQHFENQVIYLNCDDTKKSWFWFYFDAKFDDLNIKKLIATHYEPNGTSYALIRDKDRTREIKLNGNGDFRSNECIEFLKESDIVITNPPFSLFREFISQIMEYNKKFLVIGHQLATTSRELFNHIANNKMWLGVNKGFSEEFRVPEHYGNKSRNLRIDKDGNKYIRVDGVKWFTNLEHNSRNDKIYLINKYSEADYSKFDNFDAINVDKVSDIPKDYEGVMGVPISFLNKWNPEQFEILGCVLPSRYVFNNDEFKGKNLTSINGVNKYHRLLIKNKEVVK